MSMNRMSTEPTGSVVEAAELTFGMKFEAIVRMLASKGYTMTETADILGYSMKSSFINLCSRWGWNHLFYNSDYMKERRDVKFFDNPRVRALAKKLNTTVYDLLKSISENGHSEMYAYKVLGYKGKRTTLSFRTYCKRNGIVFRKGRGADAATAKRRQNCGYVYKGEFGTTIDHAERFGIKAETVYRRKAKYPDDMDRWFEPVKKR